MGDERIAIRHEEHAHRFAARIGDQIAYLAYEQPDGHTLDFAHVWVPPEHRNRGIAAQLTETALAYARDHEYLVIPSCPYVSAYVGRHREWKDVIHR